MENIISKDEAKKAIAKLIERYNSLKDDKTMISNERQICDSLIRPFFRDVLGWHIEDPYEFKSEYQEGGKRVDYLVCIEDVSQFIIEAKAPSREIKEEKEFYKQAITYAENKDRDFAILTNFRTFIILRTGILTENVFQNEIRTIDLFNLSEEDLEFLLYFSKNFWIENGQNNPLYLQKNLKKKEKIDERLVKDMTNWRELLLGSLRANSRKEYDFENKDSFSLIEEEIQRFVDRLIFICFCEDKQLEDNELKPILILSRQKGSEKDFIINKLKVLFRQYHNRYDSDLFKEGFCDNFKFDIYSLEKILEDLRHPLGRLPYDFATIDADILGRAYESFLGHTTSGKKRFKEKEDIGKRKKEGIYYTPEYIVKYIVLNTVREKVKGKSFEDILKIKILDPACGSGGFLIKAYDTLIEESKKSLKKEELSYEEKEDLMLNCIHGVDLDERACDIAKLNLSLKMASKGQKIPELHNNIRNGNSLVEKEDMDKKYFFKWKEKFPFNFDVIIGNPPYVDIKQLDPKLVRYLFENYKTVENRINLYSTFVEKSFYLLNKDGFFGFIIPNSILYNSSYNKIRELLLDNVSLKNIVRLPDNVFGDAKVETIILIYKNTKISKNQCKVLTYQRDQKINSINNKNSQVSSILQDSWKVQGIINLSSNDSASNILKEIENNSQPLVNLCDFSLGLTPYDKYKGHNKKQIEERVFHSSKRKDSTFKPLLSGSNIIRYGIFWDGKEYISYGDWLGAPREKRFFIEPRIVVRQILSGNPIRIYAGYTENELYNAQIGFNLLPKEKTNVKYILAVLNSKLMTFYHKEKYLDPSKNLFQKILIINAKKLPIRIPSQDKEKEIISLVDKMIYSTKELHELGENDKYSKQKREEEIKSIDKQIDQEVYKLYGITDQKDIDLIENSFNKETTKS